MLADPNGSFGGGTAIYLFLGPPAWRSIGETGPLNPATHADASLAGAAGVGSQVVALGDVNGDTLPDFAYSDGTTPKVVYGRTSGWTTGMAPSVTFSGSTAFDSFIAAPGDVNADGINDVLLGSSSAGGSAFLYHGRSDLASNQPVQAEIGGVSGAASAPYAAGADLNCDLSSDLLVVPVGETLTVDSADGSLKVRDQRIASSQQGQWIGPAAAPFDLRDLPEAGSLSPARAYAATRAADVSASLTTPALAFRVVGDNIDDWATDAAMVGDFDGDGKTDIAGWSNTTAADEPPEAKPAQPEDVEPVQRPDRHRHKQSQLDASDSRCLEARVDRPQTPPSRWKTRLTHSQPRRRRPAGASGTRTGTAQRCRSPSTATTSPPPSPAARPACWPTSTATRRPTSATGTALQWQFVRSDGLSGSAFSFTAASSNLGSVAGGDTGQMLTGDFDGDGRSDIAAWDGSAWATYVSQASGTTFDFSLVSNNLGALSGSDASRLVVGDFDGDGTTDLAARASDSANWIVWLSTGLAGGVLAFTEVTATSLGYDITSSVPRVTADFSGDGKSDVLALFDNSDFYAWLSQASPNTDAAPFRRVLANALQFSGSFPADTLAGDFDGDTLADYVSLDAAGTGWTFQLSDLATTRVVDDDFCQTCANDGLVWGETAFADLQPALDASWNSDILLLQPGTYSSAVLEAGRDHIIIRGTDPDAVFIDAGGGAGISLLPTPTQTYPNITGVTVENLTIRNASTGIAVNFGGDAAANPAENDPDNVVLRNVLVYADLPGSTAVDLTTSAVRLSHTTLIANAPGVTLIHSTPGLLPANAVFLQDNLFVALPNARRCPPGGPTPPATPARPSTATPASPARTAQPATGASRRPATPPP
ncbi:MAG: VCBS repeat-containing protein [Anaerolineales bacterium]|nr:VCBS repeat-containing protein [Anaerolineales bacterium]